MALFNLTKNEGSRAKSKELLKKISKSDPPPIVFKNSSKKDGGGTVTERLNNINSLVNRHLGEYKDRYRIINTLEDFKEYINKAISNDIISIDTETNGLDPILNTIAGMSIYTPGEKAAYIPLNHLSYITETRIKDQLSCEDIKDDIQRLKDSNVKVIMFNAPFDLRVIYHAVGVMLPIYWDCYIAARLLNENEPSNALKMLHEKYCMEGQKQAFTFDKLFSGFNFQYVPLKNAYIYAARDAEITYELYEFQKPYLTEEDEVCKEFELQKVAKLFRNIEMEVLPTFVDIEENGIYFDFDLADKLSEKYNNILKQREEEFWEACKEYNRDIESYRRIHGINCKLDNPINIGSPAQISILLYDILHLEPKGKVSRNKEGKPGTGEEVLAKIDHPICKAILRYREMAKLISTYVDKLPLIVNPLDNRVHAKFNSCGADTGRVSSSDPNMQNIPSRGEGKEVRQLFTATPGYVLIGSDFSSQEPRLTAHLANDKKMIQAYIDGKDLYCELASIAFDVPYEDCMEHYADGSPNAEGKKRRSTAKILLLGICYGKGIKSIAEDLGVSVQKAKKIYDKVMEECPGLKNVMMESQENAYELGFVETIWGRKRRLPDMSLPKYEFKYIGSGDENFDPLSDDEDDNELDPELCEYYENAMDNAWGFEKKLQIKEEARKDGIQIFDNTGKIAEAERKCLNSRIQGSAADQSKMALILISKNKRLKELGYRPLIPIHDEIIGEAPAKNAVEAGKIVSDLMVETAKDLSVPFKCDVVLMEHWYGKEYDEDNAQELINNIIERYGDITQKEKLDADRNN